MKEVKAIVFLTSDGEEEMTSQLQGYYNRNFHITHMAQSQSHPVSHDSANVVTMIILEREA